ncbi:replication initiation protein, partial [Oceanobacillus sp. CF4.6]|uniref:replication initiation protein n=1 Tax=Oceanobacillus sp. CF4.6 TaxID=3373080 RepID=UPI003EE63254
KMKIFSYENSIQKSNDLSMAKLSQGLTLNQMQLLAYAIYSTQKDGKTEFIKADFEKKFNIDQYRTDDAYKDSERILDLKVSTQDLANDKFKFWNAFSSMEYDKGHFIFEWNEKMIPHILELKEKYVSTDLTITSQFKSGFSWTLYDYIRAHYGYWHKPISKEALMNLFGVENVKSYQNNTGLFKNRVLNVAIDEINHFTELDVRYEVEKKGRSIVGFDLIWSTGTNQKSATKKQIKELKMTVDTVIQDSLIFIDLNDEKNRQRAIQIVKEIREMIPHTTEPICITYEKANNLIDKVRLNLDELNRFLPDESKRDTSFYYNWLEEKS